MLEKLRSSKKTGLKDGPDSSYIGILIGAFGLGALALRPDLFSEYNGVLKIVFLLLAAFSAYRSEKWR